MCFPSVIGGLVAPLFVAGRLAFRAADDNRREERG
jgi:hypothetical protein